MNPSLSQNLNCLGYHLIPPPSTSTHYFNFTFWPLWLYDLFIIVISTGYKFIFREAGRQRRTGRGARGGRGQRGAGVGKGGRKLGIRGGLVDKDSLPGPRSAARKSANKARKEDWQRWLSRYTKETEKLIEKSKRENIKCPECKEKITKSVFLNHRLRNCPQLDPKVKMGNWDISNYF